MDDEDKILLEPLVTFKDGYRPRIKELAREYFRKCLDKSDVSLDDNRRESKEYRKILSQLDTQRLAVRKTKILRGLMIAFAVIGIIALIIGIILIAATYMVALPIVLMVIGTIIAIICIVIYAVPLKNRLGELLLQVEKTEKQKRNKFEKLHKTITSITDQFDYDLPAKFISEVVPLVKLDPSLSKETMRFLDQKYGLFYNTDTDSSFEYLLPGFINGNPFLFNKNFSTYMGTKTYYGSIVITWTEEETDSEGNTYTELESEVLTASVEKPYPYYNHEISLVYFNDAAPNLVFTRDVRNASDSKREAKKLQRHAEQSTRNGDSFTQLSNTNFETRFHAWDRNNEVEFRLLFTPLAQENMLNFLDKEPEHTDFQFIKNKKVNIISDPASQDFDIFISDSCWDGEYSIDALENAFIDCIDHYFVAFYASLMPLISIPLYQQHRPEKYQELDTSYPNYSPLKYEELVNSIPTYVLKPKKCDTDIINKTLFVDKVGKTDLIKIDTYAYYSVAKTEYVSEYGGDGEWHDVPVNYYEFYPSTSNSYACVRYLGISQSEYRIVYQNLINELGVIISDHINFLRGYLIIIVMDDDLEAVKDIDEAITKVIAGLKGA